MVTEVEARSGGNPFFAEELLAISAAGGNGDAPSRVHELVLTRVQALSEPTQRMLATAAVAGRRVDHALLAEVTGVANEQLVGLLREALDHHVLVVEPGRGRSTRSGTAARGAASALVKPRPTAMSVRIPDSRG